MPAEDLRSVSALGSLSISKYYQEGMQRVRANDVDRCLGA